jgi:hypothetical protein
MLFKCIFYFINIYIFIHLYELFYINMTALELFRIPGRFK